MTGPRVIKSMNIDSAARYLSEVKNAQSNSDTITRRRIQEIIITGVIELLGKGKSDEEIISELTERLSQNSEFAEPKYKQYYSTWIKYHIQKYEKQRQRNVEDEER